MWKDLFSFSRRERNGILVLLFLIVVIFFSSKLYLFFYEKETIDYSEFESQISKFEKSLKRKSNSINSFENITPFLFNPNTISSDSLELLGFSKKIISVLNNYRDKGGKFYKNKDLKKIYGLSEKQYKFLEPFIIIDLPKNNFSNKTKKINKLKYDSLFHFDPNKIDYQNLRKLGFTVKLSKTLLKFRKSGGRFYKKEDVKKIYGMTNDFYALIAPYINCAVAEEENFHKSKPEKKQIMKIEINSADSANLVILRGIGKVLSARIIRYRKLLGGFYKKEQLTEVYGLSETTFNALKEFVIVDTNLIKKININFASKKDFEKHPYLNYQDAKSIVKFRTKNGSFKNVKTLQTNHVISTEIYEKVKHYLSIK